MKPETYVGIALLVLFLVAAVFADPMIFNQVTSMIGCFAVGWNIPNVSKFLVDYFRKYVAKTA